MVRGAADLFHLAYKERCSTAKIAGLAMSTSVRVKDAQVVDRKHQMNLIQDWMVPVEDTMRSVEIEKLQN